MRRINNGSEREIERCLLVLSFNAANLDSAKRALCVSLSRSCCMSSLSFMAADKRVSQPTERAWCAVRRDIVSRASCNSWRIVLLDISVTSLLTNAWFRRCLRCTLRGRRFMWAVVFTFSKCAFSLAESSRRDSRSTSFASFFVTSPWGSLASLRLEVDLVRPAFFCECTPVSRRQGDPGNTRLKLTHVSLVPLEQCLPHL